MKFRLLSSALAHLQASSSPAAFLQVLMWPLFLGDTHSRPLRFSSADFDGIDVSPDTRER